MAKQKRALPARKPRDRSRDDDSLLLRSAESLGRVIGALQRQLDGATKRLSYPPANGDSSTARPRMRKSTAGKIPRATAATRSPSRKAKAARPSAKKKR